MYSVFLETTTKDRWNKEIPNPTHGGSYLLIYNEQVSLWPVLRDKGQKFPESKIDA